MPPRRPNRERPMGTKNNPGQFDCYANAAPDEPMFVLLGRDPIAPGLVEAWADQRELRDAGAGIHQSPKVAEARACAQTMRDWLVDHGKGFVAGPTFNFAAWAEDENGWQQETGAAGIMKFAGAVQMWAWAQARSHVTVREAAQAFNRSEEQTSELQSLIPTLYDLFC